MHIKFLGELEQYESKELFVENLKQVLMGIKHHYGQELADKLINDGYKYVLYDSKYPEKAISIHPQMATMNFAEYDTLLIVPDVGGDLPVLPALIAYVGVVAAYAITIIVNIALSIALSMILSLLSPTPEFEADPAAAQKLDSSLFNGAPNIREQGGSVPLAFGRPHCGGVLISTGISSEEKTI